MKHSTTQRVTHLRVTAGIDCKHGKLSLGTSTDYEARLHHLGLREMEFRVTVQCKSKNVNFSTGARSRGTYTLNPKRSQTTHPAVVVVSGSAVDPLPDTSDVTAKVERRRLTAPFKAVTSVGVPIVIN